MQTYRYAWPASALTADDMAVLYRVRESLAPKTPITQLIVQAVRAIYAVQSPHHVPPFKKEAA